MLPTSSQIRAAARQSLRGNWLPAIGITLLMAVIMGILSYIPFFGAICALLLAGPLTVGLYAFFLKLVRAEKAEVGMLFGEFQNYGDKLLLTILIAVFTFLWTLLLIIPGIIAAYRYSQAYFIMKDNPGISAMDAIQLSKEMMAGHKFRLFVLNLSFIGWAILAAIPFGLGFIWLCPYMMASLTVFYQDLKDRTSASFSDPGPHQPITV
jgi:uncharacterized membrane protein